jgi:DNA-binding NtrC family response regulator
MVIEDEKEIRDLVRYNLERAGYRVAAFADGEEGLERLFASRNRRGVQRESWKPEEARGRVVAGGGRRVPEGVSEAGRGGTGGVVS